MLHILNEMLLELTRHEETSSTNESGSEETSVEKSLMVVAGGGSVGNDDGGNKDVEAKLYAGFLPRGAGYFQHDFSYSLDPKVQKGWFASSYSLKPMYEDVGKMFNSCGRFWIVV